MNISTFNTCFFLSQMYLPRLWLLPLWQRLVLFPALAGSLDSIIPEGISITVVIAFIIVVIVIVVVIITLRWGFRRRCGPDVCRIRSRSPGCRKMASISPDWGTQRIVTGLRAENKIEKVKYFIADWEKKCHVLGQVVHAPNKSISTLSCKGC